MSDKMLLIGGLILIVLWIVAQLVFPTRKYDNAIFHKKIVLVQAVFGAMSLTAFLILLARHPIPPAFIGPVVALFFLAFSISDYLYIGAEQLEAEQYQREKKRRWLRRIRAEKKRRNRKRG